MRSAHPCGQRTSGTFPVIGLLSRGSRAPTNWDALESDQPAPLALLIADILQRPGPNAVEDTAREVLALYEDEEASFEQAARLNQGGGFPRVWTCAICAISMSPRQPPFVRFCK